MNNILFLIVMSFFLVFYLLTGVVKYLSGKKYKFEMFMILVCIIGIVSSFIGQGVHLW